MANVLSMPQYHNQHGYNGFDMSQLNKFTSTIGELLPVYFDVLEPGDKITAKIQLKTRTQPLATAAMAQINEHVEWFFVPITQIYSIFGDWRFQIQDFKSSLFTPGSQGTTFPYALPSVWNAIQGEQGQGTLDDKYFYNIGETTWRLLEMLGLGVSSANESIRSGNITYSMSPLLLCAYQKIYMDYYRLSDWESNDPSCYNLDKFYSAPSSLALADLLKMSTLRYRPRKKDFFTHGFSSPLFGGSSTSAYGEGNVLLSTITDSFKQWLVPAIFDTAKQSYNTSGRTTSDSQTPTNVRPNGSAIGSQASAQWNAITALSPDSIRTSFALQKMLEVTRRGGKHYDRQVLAHYGVDVPTGIAGEVMYLGSQNGDISIGDVIATSNGTSAAGSNVLGQIAGKGYGFTDKGVVKFTAPAHGVLMAIYSADVDLDWIPGVDKFNQLINLNDWYMPEYDNLGMQPLFNYQMNDWDPSSATTGIVHWQYRYMERKVKYNRILGGFARGLNYWTVKSQMYRDLLLPVSRYLVNPSDLNSIMLASYNAGQLVWDTDPLLHELYCDVKKASKMSTFGVQSL